MIPGLINEAETDIAVSHKRLIACKALSAMTPTLQDGWDVYPYPTGCREILHAGLLDMESGKRFFRFRIGPGKQFRVPHGTNGNLILEYWRYPEKVDETTADTKELDNEPDAQECIPYYVAYGMLLYDDPARAQVMKQEYETRIAKLREEVWLEPGPILNRYRGE